MFWYQFGPLTAIAALITDRTQWANDYTEKKFLSIEVGDSSDSVIKTMGKPLKIIDLNSEKINKAIKDLERGEVIWYYTVGPGNAVLSGTSGSTHVRGYIFDKKREVKERLRYFYFD